jgi:hypothetical protein
MKPTSPWKSFAYVLGAFLLMISAARYVINGDIVGAIIAGGASLLAIFTPRLIRTDVKQED